MIFTITRAPGAPANELSVAVVTAHMPSTDTQPAGNQILTDLELVDGVPQDFHILPGQVFSVTVTAVQR